MTVRFRKTAEIRIPDDDPNAAWWWADYEWRPDDQLWYRIRSNGGFSSRFDIPDSMSDKEMTLLALKHS